MRRVTVTGSSGSGKSTFARALAERIGAPYIELDALHWTNAEWIEPSNEEFAARVDAAIAGDDWVVDGNYHGKIGLRVWSRADTLVWLDVPLALALWRILRRSVVRAVRREQLWGTNRETFRNLFASRRSLLWFALRTHGPRRARIRERLARPEAMHLTVHHFRSTREADSWLHSVVQDVQDDVRSDVH